jgi:dihydrolipoamide dehydrogenase
MSERFDLTVIGGGPGGYVTAIRASQLGLKVAIVEKDRAMGGTCLLRGCIPTKAMLHDADVWSQVKKGGLIKGEFGFDWTAVLAHKDKAIQVNSKGVEFLLKQAKVTTFRGTGSIPAPGRVEVKGEAGVTTLESPAIVIATGSEPRTIPGIAVDEERIVTSNGALGLKKVPERIAVLGSGAVGVEFASVFSRFGSKVTLLELLPRIVPNEDEEVSAELERAFKKQGMAVHTRTTVTKAAVEGDRVRIEAKGEDGQTLAIEADVFLVSVGRRPVSEGLGLERIGVKVDRGFIPVDAHQRTSVAGIYAIGDVAPGAQLAHKAMAEGIVAAETIASAKTVPVDHRLVPGATYCEPEIGSVGLTEAKAREKGLAVKVGKFPFTANGRAKIEGLGVGFVKIVAEARYDEVLGVHIIGPHATELIAEACVALRLEATSEELARVIHAHPTVSEAFGEAAHAVLGHAIHL